MAIKAKTLQGLSEQMSLQTSKHLKIEKKDKKICYNLENPSQHPVKGKKLIKHFENEVPCFIVCIKVVLLGGKTLFFYAFTSILNITF